MNNFLPFALPDIGDEEINEVVDSLKSGWITTGPKTLQFEKDFAAFIGVKYAFAVNSATSGLHLALDAIGLQSGDYVITSPYTFTATAEVIRYFDAHPLFCDIREGSYHLDPVKLEEVILKNRDKKIKAVMPVHIAGESCDMDPILEIAARYGIKVIDDAAHSSPTQYKNRLIGTLGDLSVFSFYATKTIATGEGGMITTNNDEFAKRIKVMRLHGINRDAWDRYTAKKASWYYEIVAPGYKYNLTDIASSIGIHQLKKANLFQQKREAIANRYYKELSGINNIQLPKVNVNTNLHAWHLYIIQVDKEKRAKFIDLMFERGIGCSVHFIPLHIHPYWSEKYNLKNSDYPVAFSTYECSVSLPIYTRMSEEDTTRVIRAIKESASLL